MCTEYVCWNQERAISESIWIRAHSSSQMKALIVAAIHWLKIISLNIRVFRAVDGIYGLEVLAQYPCMRVGGGVVRNILVEKRFDNKQVVEGRQRGNYFTLVLIILQC